MYNFNYLERRAKDLIASGNVADAIKIYLFMADGDQFLDGGYLGERLGDCYKKSATCMPQNTGTAER
jgi:hypothetical protein